MNVALIRPTTKKEGSEEMADYKISLAAARVNAKLTQQQVADKISVCKSTVINWEKGKTRIPFKVLTELCKLYSVPVDLIFVPNDLTSGKA